MSLEYLINPEQGPQWQDLLPGRPVTYLLRRGEGEHGKVRFFFEDADGDKTSRLLLAGDFGYVPAGTPHAYRIEEAARLLGVISGGFERFFQHVGQPTDHVTKDQPAFIPDLPRMQAAARQHKMQFMPDYTWPDA